MSTVLARNRKKSELEFYMNFVQLRNDLTRWVMNESHIPKKYRYVFAVPTTNMLIDIMHNITSANTMYPIDDHELQLRRDFQTVAVAGCEELYQHLQYIIDVLNPDKNTLIAIADLIDREIQLLKAWRKSNKIMVNTSKK